MKKIKSLIPVLLTAVVLVFSTASTNYQPPTLTASGTVTFGHPDITWNAITGADYYIVQRLPVGGTGYSQDSFEVIGTFYRKIDEGVDAVAQSAGICQIRYTVTAYDSSDDVITSSEDPVDFISLLMQISS